MKTRKEANHYQSMKDEKRRRREPRGEKLFFFRETRVSSNKFAIIFFCYNGV